MLPHWIRYPGFHFRLLKRSFKHFKQRRTRGFDDSELWNLDYTIAKFIEPRLRRFIDAFDARSIPPVLDGRTVDDRSAKWKAILEKMHRAFALIVQADGFMPSLSEAEHKEIQEGLDLFREYYFDLWD